MYFYTFIHCNMWCHQNNELTNNKINLLFPCSFAENRKFNFKLFEYYVEKIHKLNANIFLQKVIEEWVRETMKHMMMNSGKINASQSTKYARCTWWIIQYLFYHFLCLWSFDDKTTNIFSYTNTHTHTFFESFFIYWKEKWKNDDLILKNTTSSHVFYYNHKYIMYIGRLFDI